MKLSDYQKAAVVPIIPAMVNWKKTHIGMTEGAAESAPPYMRDALPKFHRRKKLHKALDRMIDESGMSEEEATKMHVALDAALDMDPNAPLHEPATEENENDSEAEENPEPAKVSARKRRSESEEEPEPDDEVEAMDAVNNLLVTLTAASKPKPVVSRSVTYATDHEMVKHFLPLDMLCADASQQIYNKAYEQQANNPNRSYWAGLVTFLKQQPLGARIGDIQNKACLSTLVSKTLAA